MAPRGRAPRAGRRCVGPNSGRVVRVVRPRRGCRGAQSPPLTPRARFVATAAAPPDRAPHSTQQAGVPRPRCLAPAPLAPRLDRPSSPLLAHPAGARPRPRRPARRHARGPAAAEIRTWMPLRRRASPPPHPFPHTLTPPPHRPSPPRAVPTHALTPRHAAHARPLASRLGARNSRARPPPSPTNPPAALCLSETRACSPRAAAARDPPWRAPLS